MSIFITEYGKYINRNEMILDFKSKARRILLKESAHVHVGPDFRRNPNKMFSDLNRKTKNSVEFVSGQITCNKRKIILIGHSRRLAKHTHTQQL